MRLRFISAKIDQSVTIAYDGLVGVLESPILCRNNRHLISLPLRRPAHSVFGYTVLLYPVI